MATFYKKTDKEKNYTRCIPSEGQPTSIMINELFTKLYRNSISPKNVDHFKQKNHIIANQ